MYESDYIWYLKFQNKNLKSQLESYKNGNKFRNLRSEYETLLKEKDKKIKRLEAELTSSHAETVTVRKYWSEIFDDVEAERKKAVLKANAETKKAIERALKAERKIDILEEKLKAERLEKYAIGEELEKLKALNQKLTAQINKDFENSSIPSSMQGPARKKIPNTREKSGKKRGGQPGHKGHPRKKHVPDIVIKLDTPEEFLNNPDLYKTKETIKKQLVEVSISTRVIEYSADVWRSKSTKKRFHAPFPEGVINDVNYGESVKGLAFLLESDCNVSEPKTKGFLCEATNGKIDLSIGMLNGLCEEFASKSVDEQNRIMEDLMTSPTMNADFTSSNVNGETRQILILASDSKKKVLFIPRESKGHKGIIGTPLEKYVGTIIHDHDTTFYSYGTSHQECHQHNIRYAKGSIENEPNLTWNVKMRDLIREMLHYRNSLGEDELDADIVADFEKRYDEILDLGDKEYLDNPPSDYYREGINLCKRLRKYKDSELRFLHDKKVSANNSLCERFARVFKRKQKQAIVFRDFKSLNWLCYSMSTVYSMRQETDNIYERVVEIFKRKRAYKKERKKKEEGATSS